MALFDFFEDVGSTISRPKGGVLGTLASPFTGGLIAGILGFSLRQQDKAFDEQNRLEEEQEELRVRTIRSEISRRQQRLDTLAPRRRQQGGGGSGLPFPDQAGFLGQELGNNIDSNPSGLLGSSGDF